MTAISVTLRDAPSKMTSEGISSAEEKFSNTLVKQFSSLDQLRKAHKAYQAAMDGDVPLTTNVQSQAMSFHAAITKATQIALGGYKATEETRFDVRLT